MFDPSKPSRLSGALMRARDFAPKALGLLALCMTCGVLLTFTVAASPATAQEPREPRKATADGQQRPRAGSRNVAEEPRGEQPRPRPNPNELLEEDMPDAMAVLRDYRPELVERFENWVSSNPETARATLAENVPMLPRLIRMRRDDPKGYELAIEDLRYYRETATLSRQLRQARRNLDDAQVTELTQKLQTILDRHFELRQKIREREIQKLEERLDQLRKQLEIRASARQKILQSRLDQLANPPKRQQNEDAQPE